MHSVYITIHSIINKTIIMKLYLTIIAIIAFLGVLISIISISRKEKDDDVGMQVFILIISVVSLIEVAINS